MHGGDTGFRSSHEGARGVAQALSMGITGRASVKIIDNNKQSHPPLPATCYDELIKERM